MPHNRERRTYLIDATLREGMQSPYTVFDSEDVMRIAERVVAGGADMIEVGHPYISHDAMHHTRSVVDMQLGVPVLAHARAKRPDILAVANSGAEWVGIFLGVNAISENARLGGRSFNELLEKVHESTSYAKSMGLRVRFTIEDASRTDQKRLSQAYAAAIQAGADRICFADSVGSLEPTSVTAAIAQLRGLDSSVQIETHFHNDRGLAMANTLAAVDAGADWMSVSINGLGERCGITDHAVLAVNLLYRNARALSVGQMRALEDASDAVSRCSGQPVSLSHPVLGEYAFTHTARLHVLAVEKDKRSYEWIAPDRLGRSHKTAPLRQLQAVKV